MKLKFNLAEKLNRPSFAGFQHKKSDTGSNEYEFNLPYDESKYTASLEILKVKADENNNYLPSERIDKIDLPPSGVKIDLKNEYNIAGNKPFAYRYILKDKNGKEDIVIDSGTKIHNDYGDYNLVHQLGSKLNKGGAMYLLIPDSFNVGWVWDKNGEKTENKTLLNDAKKTTKTFSNKFGGTLAGIIKKIPYLKEQGYTRIVSTPMFTDDSLSAHGYWIKNAMQMSQSLGSINNYGEMIRDMFKADMNLVADGAFVNEGLEGVHFRDVLKRGEDSPYYHWFRAEGLKNGPLGMGVFAKNHEFISHRVINSPHKYVQDPATGIISIQKNMNEKYNPKKPTYVQIYDNRFGSIEEDENPIAISTHEDTIINYSFPINPDTYNDNIKRLNEFNQDTKEPVLLGTYKAARILTKADNYSLEEKYEGGFETWDANNDIAKLNFGFSKADLKSMENVSAADRAKEYEEIEQKNLEVQDYAVSSGKYWTKKTNDVLLGYVARKLKNVGTPEQAKKEIDELIDAGKLPKSLTSEGKINSKVIENIFNDNYVLKTTKKTDDYKELLLSGLMDVPLDSIEFGDEITAVLGFPYITNRASKKSELGMSRYDLYKHNNPQLDEKYASVYNKTTKMYSNEMLSFADEIMSKVNAKMPADNKIFNGSKSDDYGKYVVQLMAQEIAKFAVIKALAPNEEVIINEKTGEISYDYKALKDLSLKEVGVVGLDAKNDADSLVSNIRRGIHKISDQDKSELAEAIYKQIEGTNANSFKLSEAIIDRTQAGLDWRIDAAKDIADVDTIRNSNETFGEIWQEATDFWKHFAKTVHKQNPNSYMAAELTDVGDLHKLSGATSRFADGNDAERKFIDETGINTTANYSYFFTDLARIFGKGFESGAYNMDANSDSINRNKQINDINGKYFNSAQLDSLIFSYTFAGNHDKPRALHCLALDMSLFNSNFNNNQGDERERELKYNQKKTAIGILNTNRKTLHVTDEDVENSGIDFSMVSPKAIAMADAVKSAMADASIKAFGDGEKNNQIYKAISESVSDLAQGHYLDTTFTPDSFGVKPFDKVINMVLRQAEKEYGLKLSPEDKKTLVNKTFETMLKPAMSRMESMMGFLAALPGNPTMFAGDELGLTGYEEKCKNIYLQNRSVLNWDILDDENKTFVKEYNDQINKTMRLRKEPRLRALNTGAPFALELQNGRKYIGGDVQLSGVLRQDTDGSMVVSIFNPSGFDLNNKNGKNNKNACVTIDKLSLKGITGGIKAGTKFYNVKNNKEYKVYQEGDFYYIRQADGYPVELTEGSMINSNLILTTEPPTANDISFKGKKMLYNPQYNFVSNPYQQVARQSVGIKFKSCV